MLKFLAPKSPFNVRVCVCCSVLLVQQCVAICLYMKFLAPKSPFDVHTVCCSVLQRVAACCSAAEPGAKNPFHCACQCLCLCLFLWLCLWLCLRLRLCRGVAVFCRVLQCVAAYKRYICIDESPCSCGAVWCTGCSVLQCVAVCCSLLQCVAVCCTIVCIDALPAYTHTYIIICVTHILSRNGVGGACIRYTHLDFLYVSHKPPTKLLGSRVSTPYIHMYIFMYIYSHIHVYIYVRMQRS